MAMPRLRRAAGDSSTVARPARRRLAAECVRSAGGSGLRLAFDGLENRARARSLERQRRGLLRYILDRDVEAGAAQSLGVDDVWAEAIVS